MKRAAIQFIRGEPALLIRKQRTVVIGDLHIGVELGLGTQGIHVSNASQRLASRINSLQDMCGARSLVFLGDIKESIGHPTKEEADAIRIFFRALSCKKIGIAKGNHDANLKEIVASLGLDIEMGKELFVGDCALLHGNALPSDDAMRKRYIITGHMHPALFVGGEKRKVWLISRLGKKSAAYKHGKETELIIAPAFNDLIVGSAIDRRTKARHPLFKNDVFDFGTTKVFGLDGDLIGKIDGLR
ncbi:MAG: hypothetical protein KGH49_03215 [Candidatus Micrarchaeota archaeon]|nr:hypothetical protein [Candidatus Micrarchaeota archaeon]